MTDEHATPRRRPLVGLLTLLLVGAAVVAVVVIAARHDSGDGAQRPPAPTRSAAASSTRPVAAPSSTGPVTAAPLPVGITFGNRLFGRSRARIDQALDDVVRLHMTWIRIDMSWASLQPTSSARFDWHPMDEIIASARRHRLTVLGLLSYTPSWARSPGCSGFTCPPRSAARFARFAAAVATRYRKDGVTTYQVWNEPNINLFWASPDPLRYRSLLAATVTALRTTGGGLRILFGGLAVAQDRGPDLSASTFVRRACAGRACHVDAVGYDPYTYPALPSRTSRPLNPFQLLTNRGAGANGLRVALTAVGLGRTPVWVTGFGAPTAAPGYTDARAVGEARQSAILVDGLRLAHSAGVGSYFVDTLRDSSPGGTFKNHFGLEQVDGSHKPAFAALARALGS